MAFFTKSLRGTVLTVATMVALTLGGCGGAGGVDVQVDAPILNAVGLNLGGKAKQEDDLPERQGLVMPPSTSAALPQPGERSAATQNWPADPDLARKSKAEAEAAAREKYCREGDWSSKAGINEFEKNVGREARCSSKLGDALSKSLGGGEAKKQ